VYFRNNFHKLIIFMALSCSSAAMAEKYNGQQLGLYFGDVPFEVSFTNDDGISAAQTCVAVLSAAGIYYQKTNNDVAANAYFRASHSLAGANHLMQADKPEWVDQDLYEAGTEYANAIIDEREFPNSQSWKDYKLKVSDLLRNVAKCGQVFPEHRVNIGLEVERANAALVPVPSAAPTASAETDSSMQLCAIVYDAYVRVLIEQSYADTSVTIDIRADRDAVWRKIRNRAIDALNFGTTNRRDLPEATVAMSKQVSQAALKDATKFAALKSEISNCDAKMKVPAIALGY
jgi:hypothetical protein